MKRVTFIGEDNIGYFRKYLIEIPEKAEALGLIVDKKAAGAAVFSVNDGICTIEHMYIDEKYRRKGGADMMFTKAAAAYKNVGVTDFIAYYDGDPALTGFFRKHGFICCEGDKAFYFEALDMIESEKSMNTAHKMDLKGVMQLCSANDSQKRSAAKLLDDVGIGGELLLDEECDENLTLLIPYDEDGKAVMVVDTEDKDVYVKALATGKNGTLGMKKIMAMFYLLLEQYVSVESKVHFLAMEPKVESFVRASLKKKDCLKYEGSSWLALLSEEQDTTIP